MAAATILDFWNCEILLAIWVQRVETHQLAKFHQNWSNGCEDIKIFWFFKMASSAILDCRIRKNFIDWRCSEAQTNHCTKFHQNRSFRCGDIAIYRIFKMAAAAILDFMYREILLATGNQMVEAHQHAKFGQNWSIGCEDIKILLFFKMAAVRHLGSFLGVFEPPTVKWVLGGLYLSAKFDYDRWSSFYNMNISISHTFGWKMLIHAPKIVFWGQFDPLNGLQYQPKPKRHTLAGIRVIWVIKCENVVKRSELYVSCLKKGYK